MNILNSYKKWHLIAHFESFVMNFLVVLLHFVLDYYKLLHFVLGHMLLLYELKDHYFVVALVSKPLFLELIAALIDHFGDIYLHLVLHLIL